MNEAALLNAAPISTVRDHEGAGRLDPRTVVASDNTARSDIARQALGSPPDGSSGSEQHQAPTGH
jgi:hypothetical protein